MEMEGHIRHNDVIDISKSSARWMISELSGSESEEATDPAKESAFFCEFVVNERAQWPECDKPSLLNEVHLLE